MIANVALDYTEWAPPVTETTVKYDIDAYRSLSGRSPSKIIMWVHQWEYLAKKYKAAEAPQYIVAESHIDTVGLWATLRPSESSDGGRLWGIPVEVRDPENHKP